MDCASRIYMKVGEETREQVTDVGNSVMLEASSSKAGVGESDKSTKYVAANCIVYTWWVIHQIVAYILGGLYSGL